MKNKKPIIKELCDKCGKEPQINKNLSNENWTVYDTKTPCECGGKWKMKIIYETNTKNTKNI